MSTAWIHTLTCNTHYKGKGSRFVRNVGTIHVPDGFKFPSSSSEIQKYQTQNFIAFPVLCINANQNHSSLVQWVSEWMSHTTELTA